ncbi:MAG TPA: PAS domain S-box protein [Flavisolibacter sp.]|nr:PAS domain S-box protein [Flavisolibacter sp.]
MTAFPIASDVMFTLFELTPDLVCIAGKDGFFKKINPAVSQTLGYSDEELMSRPIASFMHPEDREYTAMKRAALLQGKPLLNLQNRYCTKAGEVVWLEWTSVYLPEKEVVFAIAKDITVRKLIDQDIEKQYRKFQGLVSHFKNSLEKDKKSLAVELHEGLAQIAVAVKMDIDWLRQQLVHAEEPVKTRLAHAHSAAELLIQSMQRISFEISPAMLEDLGVHEVLKWLCNHFTNLHNISCRMHFSIEEHLLSPELQLDVFRICQEALTGCVDPAKAIDINIDISVDKNQLLLKFYDKGKGFELEAADSLEAFNNIKKRAASVHGEVTAGTGAHGGTMVTVSICL